MTTPTPDPSFLAGHRVPVPAPGFEPTRWTMPPTGDLKLRPQFRNGYVDRHTYTAAQLRWSNTGSEWDVVAVGVDA